jgi:hypothetical protein
LWEIERRGEKKSGKREREGIFAHEPVKRLAWENIFLYAVPELRMGDVKTRLMFRIGIAYILMQWFHFLDEV